VGILEIRKTEDATQRAKQPDYAQVARRHMMQDTQPPGSPKSNREGENL